MGKISLQRNLPTAKRSKTSPAAAAHCGDWQKRSTAWDERLKLKKRWRSFIASGAVMSLNSVDADKRRGAKSLVSNAVRRSAKARSQKTRSASALARSLKRGLVKL